MTNFEQCKGYEGNLPFQKKKKASSQYVTATMLLVLNFQELSTQSTFLNLNPLVWIELYLIFNSQRKHAYNRWITSEEPDTVLAQEMYPRPHGQ